MRISDWSSDVCSSDLLRSLLGVLFIPVFLGIIYTNGLLSDAREDVSRTRSDWESAELVVKRAEPQPGQAAADTAALAKARADLTAKAADHDRSEEHTSELQSLMRISYAVFCLKQKKRQSTEPPPVQLIKDERVQNHYS